MRINFVCINWSSLKKNTNTFRLNTFGDIEASSVFSSNFSSHIGRKHSIQLTCKISREYDKQFFLFLIKRVLIFMHPFEFSRLILRPRWNSKDSWCPLKEHVQELSVNIKIMKIDPLVMKLTKIKISNSSEIRSKVINTSMKFSNVYRRVTE